MMKNFFMKKNSTPFFILAFLLFIASRQYAQSVGIGTNTPNVSAQLDITSNSKGFLAPRMTSSQRNAIAAPATGLLVFDTDTNSFWFYGGAAWINLITNVTGWSLTGNTGTNPANHFIGTADNQPLLFKINNQRSGYLGTNANIFFGLGSGENDTLSINNIGIGINALKDNKSRSHLVAIGENSLTNNGTGALNSWEGTENTGVGYLTLWQNTTGYYNTALGSRALYLNTFGNNNTAAGSLALYQNVLGSYNAALGADAMTYNNDGSHNTAAGFSSLYYNTSGSYNVAVGE